MMKLVKPAVLSFSLLAFAGAAYADDAKKDMDKTQSEQSTQGGSAEQSTQGSSSAAGGTSQSSGEKQTQQQSTQGGASASGSATGGTSQSTQDTQAQQSTQGGASASGSATGGTSQSSQDTQAQQPTQGGASATGSATGGTSAAGAGAETKPQEQQSQQGQSAAAGATGGASVQGAMPVERLKDMKVVDSQGEDLGKIDDVVIDLNSGKVHAVVLGVGGFVGLGEKNFAFPANELKPGKDKEQLTLNVDKQKLKDAKGFEKSAWPGMDDEYWSRMGKGQASAGSGAQSQGQSAEGVKKNLIRASEMKGQDVQDKSGKQVGKVQDVLVSLDQGQVQSIQINVEDGGQATVPAKSLSARGTDDKLVIDMSGDELRSQATQRSERPGVGGTARPPLSPERKQQSN